MLAIEFSAHISDPYMHKVILPYSLYQWGYSDVKGYTSYTYNCLPRDRGGENLLNENSDSSRLRFLLHVLSRFN